MKSPLFCSFPGSSSALGTFMSHVKRRGGGDPASRISDTRNKFGENAEVSS
jgi:hypothetical protein